MNDLHKIIRREEFDVNNNKVYIAEVHHLGYNKVKTLKDVDLYELESKIDSKLELWDSNFEFENNLKLGSENFYKDEDIASLNNMKAQREMFILNALLWFSLDIDNFLHWDKLKDVSYFNQIYPDGFTKPEITNLTIPKRKEYLYLPDKPNESDYKPDFSFFDNIIPSKRKKKIDDSNFAYQSSLDKWKNRCDFINQENKKIDSKYNDELAIYNSTLNRHHEKIEKLKELYFSKDKLTIVKYCKMVLNNSIYPEYFPKEFDIDFKADSGLLIVDYSLPSLDVLPTLKEVKYISSRQSKKEIHLTETQKAKMYDEVIYKTILRTLHELFEADKVEALKSIVFNGWVNSINRATGKFVNNCIASIKVDKDDFLEINLWEVDVKACFKSLKGIGSSKLSSLVAIQPIIQIDKTDKRFVSSYDVAEGIEGENLALMSWEDFEHLVRELFEKEFSINGGEVKVTQSSRDGGVDAIAFDPDPIRGGKIVIQAKRYTNTVGLSAVRDLYGTVLNEGATKGILVTTADYGPDAYTFAQNKPITLLNGANLLFLLEKHGHKSRIDIKEAKKLFKDNNSR